VPGGSSSGAAISVTDGMAAAGLGTDTAGSVRIPAALCGLAGYKPTVGRVPTGGIFPLSTSLDSVGPLAPSLACCVLVDAIFSGEEPTPRLPVPLNGLRFGIPDKLVIEDLAPDVAFAFERSVTKLSEAGARFEDVSVPGLDELASVGRVRFPSQVEGYAIHQDRLAHSIDQLDPRIADRLMGGSQVSGAEYYDVLRTREDLMVRSAKVTRNFDAIAMPTIPVTAPPIAQFQGSDEALRDPFIIVIRNASIANLLGRCALTVPCHEDGEAPVGFMLMGETMHDHRLMAIGLSVDALLNPNIQ